MASSNLRAWTIATGVVVGVAYALSPLTMWFVVAMFGLFTVAVKGLPADERRRILVILTVAVALRLLALAVLFVGSDHTHSVSFFWDGDGLALKRRSLWIRNTWLGVPMAPIDFANAYDRLYGWTTFLYVLAYLQYLAGPAPYAIHLLNVGLFIGTATILYRLARSAYGPVPASLGLTILLFLPTPFLWSVSVLKEALYVFLLVCAMVAAIGVVRSRSWAVKVLAIGALVATLEANGTVRTGALAIGTLGLAAGVMGSVVARRLSIALLVIVLLPFVSYRALRRPDVEARIMSQLKTSAVLHMGNVRTEGHAYKLLDERFYSASYDTDPTQTMTPAEGARFVIRAVASFVLVPVPWQVESRQEMLFLPQQVAWYILVILAITGLVGGLRRDALVTSLLVGLAAAGAAAIALNSGNIGTMVRHRDTVVPFIVWLSAVGAVDLASVLARFGTSPTQNGLYLEARATCH